VSATIDHAHFQRHFERRLPKGFRCGIVVCSGKKPHPLLVHYRRDGLGHLPYAEGALREFSKTAPQELADAILRMLLTMESPPDDSRPKIEPGDVLGFLHGKREIEKACESIETYLATHHPELAARTDVYPYHAEVDRDIARKATEKKSDPSRRRVVIASNAAETSLTIEGLVHVVESGFIKQTQWDPVLEQAPLLPVVHSQAGCRQRWGRAGRVMSGWVWCLYTKSQFAKVFPKATVPEIQRSCLDSVVLKAKRGGADRIEEKAFPWLDAPATEEIGRTNARLQRQQLLDADGDLTEAGVLAAMSNEKDMLYKRLLSDGDRFGFGVEVCTLIPFLESGFDDLLPFEKKWDDETKRGVREAQKRLRATCSDDLELCLRIYSDWQNAVLPPNASWKPPRLDRKEAAHCKVPDTKLIEELRSARSEKAISELLRKYMTDPAMRDTYRDRAVGALRDAARRQWPQINGVDSEVLHLALKRRGDLIQEIGAKKKGMEDRAIDFAGLDRLRAIIARAFLDQVHVRAGASAINTSEAVRYAPLFPISEDSTPVEIAPGSACTGTPPDTFVALGPKETRPAKGDRESIRVVPFVIRVAMEMVEAVREHDDLELAEYLRQTLPRPAQGSAEDARLRQHERLRRDYPAGVVVECRVLGDVRGVTEVEVTRALGWGGGPPLKFSSSERWQELREHEHDKSFEDAFPQSAAGTRSRRQSISEEEEVDLVSEEMEPSSAARDRKRPQEVSANEAVVATGRLQWFGRPPSITGQMISAEVTRHSEITAEPSLILVSPPLRERFDQFVKITNVGDEIETEIIGPSPHGSFEHGLQVRDPRTGLELLLPTDEVVLAREDYLLEGLEPGGRLRVRIELVEDRLRKVHATALQALEPELARLHAGIGGEIITGTLRHIEEDDKIYMFATVESRGPAAPVVPVKITLPRERFEGPNGFSIPYKAGRKIGLKIRANAYSSVENRAQLTEGEAASLTSAGIQAAGGQLSCRRRLTFEARISAMRTARTVELMTAVRTLYAKSNLLYAEIVIPDLVGKTVEGRVQTFRGNRMEVALAGGMLGIHEPAEASWFDPRVRLDQLFKLGQTIRAVVMSINDDGNAVLSTKRARTPQDPWIGNGMALLYPVGTTLVCKFTNAISSRAWVEIEPGLQGSLYVKEMRALVGGGYVDAISVAQPGRWVNVRVIGYDTTRKPKQINVQAVGWVTNPPTEPLPRSQSQKASPTSAHAPEPIVGWLGSAWPWDDGENAISKDVAPPKPAESQPPRTRLPLDKRSKPSGWRILL